MIELSDSQINQWLSQFLWPLFRISAFLMAAPFFGAQFMPGRVRLVLAFLITLVVAPVLPPLPVVDLLSVASILVVLQQILIGALMGLCLQVFFHVFVLAGQMISTNMGLGFASMVDPANGITVPVIAQVFVIMVNLLFVITNGHLVVLQVLVESFTMIPVGASYPREGLWLIASSGGWMFGAALLMALPLLTALLIVNIAFGVMTRTAPQLNIFSLGFPVSVMLGLFGLWITVSSFVPQYDEFSAQALALLRDLLRV